MDYNILLGGAAGQGIETCATLLEKILKRKGCEIFTVRDYMSRVRGGLNFIQIRFGNTPIYSHTFKLDGLIAFTSQAIETQKDRLSSTGFIICDKELALEAQDSISAVTKLPFGAIAKEIGNPKVFTSVALGAILKYFGFDLSCVREVLEGQLKPALVEINFAAFQRGFDLSEAKLSLQTAQNSDKYLINGNDAIALGAIAAGVKFYSAYPMTPSTSIMNYIASKMKEAEVIVEQAEDEIAGINMAIGASYAGVRSMTGTSGGGFCLKVEALGLAGMMEIPLVVANIQRPGPVTGLPTRTEQADLSFVISASHGEFPRMVIALTNPEDCFYQTIRAFNLADKYQIPVILLGDQYLADSTRTVTEFDFSKVSIDRNLADPRKYQQKAYQYYHSNGNVTLDRLIPGQVPGCVVRVDSDEHDASGNITESAHVRVAMHSRRMKKMELLEQELIEPAFFGDDRFEELYIGWGSMAGPLREAVAMLNQKGKKAAALVFSDIFPLPTKLLKEKVAQATQLINVEQNMTGQLAQLIRAQTGITMHKSILKFDGRQICGYQIVQQILGGESDV